MRGGFDKHWCPKAAQLGVFVGEKLSMFTCNILVSVDPDIEDIDGK